MGSLIVQVSSETLTALARAAGALRAVRPVAESVGLAAMNAHVLSARSGESARGFGPITSAVGDLARQVADIVDGLGTTVDAAMTTAARLFVMTQRARHLDGPALQAPELASRLITARREMARRVSERHRAYDAALRAFLGQLDRIDDALRSSHTLAVLARIEAARTPAQTGNLATIATTLDEAAAEISAVAQESRDRLAAAGITRSA